MPKRCGDLAGFSFKVSSELVGKYATTMVCRKNKFNITVTYTEKLQKEETKKVKWPDLPEDGKPDGNFYGGRKVDYKGLNKLSYSDKFKEQEFDLEIFQGKSVKKSAGSPLKIEAYPDAASERKAVGIPMPTAMWELKDELDPATMTIKKVRKKTWSDPVGNAYVAGQNCGNFHIEFKDGVVTVTVKITLTAAAGSKGKVSGKMFKNVKKTVETFWNSKERGMFQWVYHRDDCKRKDKCNCPILKDSKGKYIYTGCCKVPLQVKIEKGNDNPVTVHFLSLAQQKEKKKKGYVSGLRANTLNLYYPENNPGTFAHEVGHMMGFPDQYWYGVVEGASMDANGQPQASGSFPIDDDSIMGQNMGKAKKEHIGAKWFSDWINAKIDKMSPLKK